jgi:hypothetical protein
VVQGKYGVGYHSDAFITIIPHIVTAAPHALVSAAASEALLLYNRVLFINQD